jgi:hypothetical protein
MNKEDNLPLNVSAETHVPSEEFQGLEPRNHVTVGRRSFIRGLGIEKINEPGGLKSALACKPFVLSWNLLTNPRPFTFLYNLTIPKRSE